LVVCSALFSPPSPFLRPDCGSCTRQRQRCEMDFGGSTHQGDGRGTQPLTFHGFDLLLSLSRRMFTTPRPKGRAWALSSGPAPSSRGQPAAARARPGVLRRRQVWKLSWPWSRRDGPLLGQRPLPVAAYKSAIGSALAGSLVIIPPASSHVILLLLLGVVLLSAHPLGVTCCAGARSRRARHTA